MLQSVTVIVSLISGVIAILLYGYKFSNQLNKLNQIDGIETKIEQINDERVKDLVSFSALNQKVEDLEGAVRELKKPAKGEET